MECQCKVVNNSGLEITALILYHAPGTVEPGTFLPVLSATNLANGATVGPVSAPQESLENDWWAMGLLFTGNPTVYFLADSVRPWTECETPANGSAAIVIGSIVGVGYPSTIVTFENSDFTSLDGSCDDQLVTVQALDTEGQSASQLVAMIDEALGQL